MNHSEETAISIITIKIECNRCERKVDLPKLIDQVMESIGNIVKLYTERYIVTK